MMQRVFPQNEAAVERAIRVLLGVGLLALIFVGPKTLWGLVGVVPLLTGAIGSCPIYTALGFSTSAAKNAKA